MEGIERETRIVSLYRYLEENYGFGIERTKDVIAAATADFYEAQIPGVPVGTAMLDASRLLTHRFNGFEHMEEALMLMKDKPRDLIKPW